MTKLDRAIIDEDELQELNDFYRTLNISAHDLFKILTKVRNHMKRRILITHETSDVFTADSTCLLRYDYGLQLAGPVWALHEVFFVFAHRRWYVLHI